MTLANILITFVVWIFQKMIIPVLPTNLPFFSFYDFQDLLTGDLQHNLTYSFSGLNSLFDLELLFTFLIIIIFAEMVLFLVRVALFVIRMVRG